MGKMFREGLGLVAKTAPWTGTGRNHCWRKGKAEPEWQWFLSVPVPGSCSYPAASPLQGTDTHREGEDRAAQPLADRRGLAELPGHPRAAGGAGGGGGADSGPWTGPGGGGGGVGGGIRLRPAPRCRPAAAAPPATVVGFLRGGFGGCSRRVGC